MQVSKDGVRWNIVKRVTGQTVGGTQSIIGFSADARYVCILGTARTTQWGYSLWEIEVYE